MTGRLSLAAFLCLAPIAAAAAPAEDWSARIAAEGLERTAAALDALTAPTPDDLFAQGGVHFLRAVERALHLRWEVGATEPLAPVPVLRAGLPPNPAPAPFRASLVAEVFSSALAELDLASAALSRIGDGDAVGIEVRLADIWLDIDGSGGRGPGEGLAEIAGAAFLGPVDTGGAPPPAPVIRFDTADAAWLDAYAHLLSAVSEFVLAFDPTEATRTVYAARAEVTGRLGAGPGAIAGFVPEADLDKAMIALLALRQKPDPARTRAAKEDLKAMVALNGAFWARVARETDNAAEWIPNGRQTGVGGLELPPETGATWLAVLDDLAGMLDGRLVVPHWALPPGSGIDVGKWLDDPSPLDPIGWLHGIDAFPYARQGPAIDGRSWRAFEQMVGGDSLLYALVLN